MTNARIQCQLRLRPTKAQERQLRRWLWHLTGVYNWAIRKIEQDARHGIYYSRYDIQRLLNRHGRKLGIPNKRLSFGCGDGGQASP